MDVVVNVVWFCLVCFGCDVICSKRKKKEKRKRDLRGSERQRKKFLFVSLTFILLTFCFS